MNRRFVEGATCLAIQIKGKLVRSCRLFDCGLHLATVSKFVVYLTVRSHVEIEESGAADVYNILQK